MEVVCETASDNLRALTSESVNFPQATDLNYKLIDL